MGGFKNESNNIAFEDGLFKLIILHLHRCSREMKETCIETGYELYNHEDRITNRLIANHLNFNNLRLRFILQSPETFIPNGDKYRGRCDIKVVSDDWLSNQNDYYLIECKRIDGADYLNRQFVSEGISRFVVNPPKYPSYHKRNIMFGYVVKAIDIPDNTVKIDQLQGELLVGVLSGRFSLVSNESAEFYHYSCEYKFITINTIESIELAHLFYDFSGVIAT